MLSPLLTACSEEADDLLFEMALEWAAEKNLITCGSTSGDPDDCEPTFNYIEIGRYATGFGADPEVQAAFDTGIVARDIQAADQLAAEALATGDVSKFDEAIALRPSDWTYHEQRAAFLLGANGDVTEFNTEAVASEELANQHIDDTLEAEGLARNDPLALKVCDSTYSNLYRHRESALVTQLDQEVEPENATLLIQQLDLVRARLADLDANAGQSPCLGYGP